MIFGAGINQIELIREAKKLGIVSVAIDPQPDPPGRAEADFFYQIDGPDYDATRTVALNHKVSGIVTGQMEKPMRIMARLAQDLHLRFHSPEVVERSLDKWLMKRAFQVAGVPCANGRLFKESDMVDEKSLAGLVFPLIIKPKDATSSQGVYRLENFHEIGNYIGISRSFSRTREIIIEEFLDGQEISVEAFTFHGRTSIVQFTKKYVTPFPRTVEMGHLQPAGLTGTQKREVTRIIETAIKAIGVDNSATHTEVKMTSNGPKIVEIGARLGGDFIASYLTKSSTGVSMDRAALHVALDQEPDLRKTGDSYSYIRYLEIEPGKIVKEVLPQDDLRRREGLVFFRIFVKPGDEIQQITHSALRPACLLVKGDSEAEVIELADKYEPMLGMKVLFANEVNDDIKNN